MGVFLLGWVTAFMPPKVESRSLLVAISPFVTLFVAPNRQELDYGLVEPFARSIIEVERRGSITRESRRDFRRLCFFAEEQEDALSILSGGRRTRQHIHCKR